MNSRALYYPYINVPKSTWLSQQLLYHDCIGAIVPYEYVYNPEQLSNYMRDLVSSGLVQQIIPSLHINHNSTFDLNFLHILDKHTLNLNSNLSAKIHIEKFGEGLKTELEAKGLLRVSEYPWYFVEMTTANLLMTYVASIICADESLEMQPITDNPNYIELFLSQDSKNEKIVLEELIPVPERPIPISELVKFKEKHGHSLSAFRDKVSSNVERISSLTDLEIRNFELTKLTQDLKEEINEISNRLTEKNWGRLNFVTICSLASSVIPVIEAAQISSPEELYKATPGLIGAIVSEYTSRRKEFKQLQSHSLSYAAYVKQLH